MYHQYLTILTAHNQQTFASQCSQSSYLEGFSFTRCKQSYILRFFKIQCFLGNHLALSYTIVIQFAKVGTKHNTLAIHSDQTTDFFVLFQLIQQFYLSHCLKHAFLQTFPHRRELNHKKASFSVGHYCIFQCGKTKQFVFCDIFRDAGLQERYIMIESVGRVVFIGGQVPNDELSCGIDC